MEYSELISTRESVRNYDHDRPLTKDVLERILDAGRLAPSACNIQPWRFIVVSSPEMLAKVGASYKREWFMQAPHILIVVGEKNKAWSRSFDAYNSVETDVTIAMTQMILAAENEGVGTCWVANYNPFILSEALKLSSDEVVYCITPLGYQKPGYHKNGNKTRKPLNEIVQYL